MITRYCKYRIVVAGLVLMVAVSFRSDTAVGQERRGTAGAAHLIVTPTARLAALGSAGTAGSSGVHGVEMLFVNPAGVTLNEGTGVLFSRMEYLVDVDVNTIAVAQEMGSNQLALFVNSWNLGDIPRQTEANPEISDLTFNPQITTVGLTYARTFTDRIAAGVTVKVVNEDIDDMGATAAAFDGGLTYVVAESGIRFGLSVRNIGSKLTFSGTGLARQSDDQGGAPLSTFYIASEPIDLPTLLNAGVTYTRAMGESLSLSAQMNFRSNSFDQDQYAAGLEIGFIDAFYLRGGFEWRRHSSLTVFRAGSFGTGLDLDVSGVGLTFDYAYRPTDFFSDVQLFTLIAAI